MLLSNSIRVRLAAAVPLLALVALLSCKNDSTGPKPGSATVSTTLPVDAVRLPDSVSWKAMGDSGAFQLTIVNDTTFHVQATLPKPLGSDTLTLSAWTLTLRTTEALFQADAEGTLHLLSSTRDSLSIRLLQAFDSLRGKSPTTWGSSSDPKAAQILSLEKAYATLLLSRDATVLGFPATHPVGLDSLAVVDQLLFLAVQDGYTYHTLDSLVPLDSTKLRTEVRVLAVAKKLDSNAIFPPPPFVPNHAPTFAGALSISRTFDTTIQTIPNWITAISPGLANESSQSIHFEVVTDSGASYFSLLPSVDSAGTLRYQAKSVGRGVFRVRAHDNGDSTGTNVNISGWTSFAIQLFSRPVLIATGPSDTVRLVEDSATSVSFTVQNFVGSSLAVKFSPVDTTLISAQTWKLVPDANGKVSISLQGKQNVFGGPLTTIVTLTDSLDVVNLIVPITISERNHPPSFGGAPNLVVTTSAAQRTFPGWIDSIAAGPASESYQKVSFQVQVPSGSSLFAKTPSVDSTGTLSFAGNVNSSGLAQIQIRAVDNDSVDPGNRYSAWKASSIYFNQPPTLILPTHALSTWENQPVSAGLMTVSDSETSQTNLKLTWGVIGDTILPHDSVIANFSGSTSPSLILHPLADRWGSAKVVFTVTDSFGASVTDSLTLTVNPINHAPTIGVKSPHFVYSYKGEQSQTLATMIWDSVIVGQKGSLEIRGGGANLVSLRVDSSGALFAAPKVDTHLTIKFQIRARDNGGTLHGGVDTSNWSDSISLEIVDTVQDAQGNDYRVKVMGGQTWMAQNVRTSVNSAFCGGDCQTYGRLYLWNQVMSLDGICNTTNCTSQIQPQHQGICPTGWHVPRTGEWSSLAIWAGNGDSTLGINRLKSGGSIWSFSSTPNGGSSCGYTAVPGYFGFDLYPSTGLGTIQTVGGGMTVTICAPSAEYWAISQNNRNGALSLGYGTYAGVVDSVNSDALGQFRCVKNSSERSYYGVAP